MKRLFIIFNLFIIISCSSNSNNDKDADLKLYKKAIASLTDNKFIAAADHLQELETNHPFSTYIDESEVLLAFIKFTNKDYEESYNYTEKFIRLRPANKNVAYMYYLRSLALNKQSSDYLREQSTTLQAQRSFRELLIRFPKTDYAKDATIKLNHITNKLSAHDMALVRFYEIQKLYIAALNVVQRTLAEYPNSPYSAEASFREIELLTILGLIDIRDAQLTKMLTKFPGSKWSIEAKAISVHNI
ncbi:MAG: outer membrane protein assembly factor BamD [Rickettsiales bacterium]|jgi:outer membrane protein assembly factor BamD|nr:outer membrane protein assembly factor BamD [Rickettsiales bacterium]